MTQNSGGISMSKICIVADSSTGISQSLAKKLNITIAPLSIIIDGKEYQDQVEMSAEQLIEQLNNKAVPTTAQPNLGLLDKMMEELKTQDFDHILVFSLTSHLSGTYQAFVLAANNHDITNIDVVDTKTLGGPVKDIVIKAATMVQEGAQAQDILDMAKSVTSMTLSFLYPNTLDQLKRGGRVSPAVAALSSLLKIKPLLILENGGTTIEKFATARTETKIFDTMIEKIVETSTTNNFKVHVLHCDGVEIAENFAKALKQKIDNVEIEIAELPAVLAAHAGIKSIAVQTSLVL